MTTELNRKVRNERKEHYNLMTIKWLKHDHRMTTELENALPKAKGQKQNAKLKQPKHSACKGWTMILRNSHLTNQMILIR